MPIKGGGGGGSTAHSILSATHDDALAAAVVAGALIYGNNTPKWAILVHGDDGDVLTLNAGLPIWSPPGGGEAHELLSATHSDSVAADVVAGDLIIGNATPKWARLAKGNAGQVLTMGASLPAWAAPASGTKLHSMTQTAGSLSTNSTSYTNLESVTATTNGGDVWFCYMADNYQDGTLTYEYIKLQVDTVDTGIVPLADLNFHATVDVRRICIQHLITGLSAASHTFLLRWLSGSSGATMYIRNRTFMLIEL